MNLLLTIGKQELELDFLSNHLGMFYWFKLRVNKYSAKVVGMRKASMFMVGIGTWVKVIHY